MSDLPELPRAKRPAGESRPRRGLDFETVGSIVAIIIGLAALAVSWQETSNTRKDRLASALPVMETGTGASLGDELSIAIRIENAGVGTALVYSARLNFDGRPIRTPSELQEALGETVPLEQARASIDAVETRPLPPGTQAVPFRLSWPVDTLNGDPGPLFKRLSEQRPLQLEVCFCDVYERCWETRPDAFPEPIDACPEPTGFPGSVIL